MNTETARESAARWAVEVLHTSSKTITSLAIVVSFLALAGGWLWERMIGPAVETELRSTLGIGELSDSVSAVDANVTAQSALIDRISRRLDDLTPEPVVAEYDSLRSVALAPCTPGQEICRVAIRSRRTDFGTTCGVPQVKLRTFIDAIGVRTQPARRNPSQPRAVDGDWSTVYVDFTVPVTAALGTGEYVLTLIYNGCWKLDVDGNRVDFPPLTQSSIPVRVPIVEVEDED